MTIKKRIKQLSELTVADWFLLCYAILLLSLIAVALKLLGLKKTRTLMAKFIPHNSDSDYSEKEQLAIAHHTVRIVAIAANHGLYKANCLKKSLVGWWLLAKRGILAELTIGAKKKQGNLQTHAWLVLNGIPLEQPVTEYKAFDNLAADS